MFDKFFEVAASCYIFCYVFKMFFCVLLQQKGTKAPQAAGKIHTDFEKGFIMAEVMKFIDFKEEGSEVAAKVCVFSKGCAWTHALLEFCQYQHWLSEETPVTIIEMCPLFHSLLENTGNWAGPTRWRTATLSSSNSTHPVSLRRNHEQTQTPEGELRARFSLTPKSHAVWWVSFFTWIQRINSGPPIICSNIWRTFSNYNDL